MVVINRSNTRRVHRPGDTSLLTKLNILLDNLPYVSQLSPIDRLLLLCGAALLLVVLFSYFLLISNIISADATSGIIGGSSYAVNDPRLSSELRKTGLSQEALLRRGGGKRITVNDSNQNHLQQQHSLDSEENALALDIINSLNCDALQDELERDWKTLLDGERLKELEREKWSGGGFGGGNTNEGGGLFEGGHADDYAAELAKEMNAVGNTGGSGGGEQDRWANANNIGGGDGNEPLDDFVNRRRRLFEEEQGMPDFDDPDAGNMGHLDDVAFSGRSTINEDDYGLKLNAKHLFCLAANALTLPKYNPLSDSGSGKTIKDPTIHCDINSFETRESLLYLWASASSQMPHDVLLKTLHLVNEHKESLRGNEVHLWYPPHDAGTEGMLRVINSAFEGQATYNFDNEPADSAHDDMYRLWDLPKKFVGANKLFVDVGSALGLTTMLISYLYPETTIVSIEPASPSWLIQNINYRCNLPYEKQQYIHPILAGVGTKHHADNDYMMKMVWRSSMTTATRSWNPEKEFDFAFDMELVVHLRPLRSILAEATPEDLPLGTPISILNLDCEGCEYNLIPPMPESSFNSIGLILGRTNWGFIPLIKKPSSERAKSTHERLCTHYNFAKRCKECCDFPLLEVKPRLTNSMNGNNLSEGSADSASVPKKTVAEVAGTLCNGFDEWASDNKLHDIPDDFGWNEMSASAAFAE
jgi:FkbM family methyltransferase|mmetsp:Transcript_11449/g.25219  ORF Transcript_11449/g.25219 Transcript_11449/m.25219 type:complete len:701 (-) Transcript_11449:1088-3190(-)